MKPTFITRALGTGVLAFALAASASSQAAPFRFTKDLIPADAGPVLGLADFDGDGDLDLLTNGTGVYLNDGNGLFTPHPVLSPVVSGIPIAWDDTPLRPVAIGDLNNDGLPDVVALAPPNLFLVKWLNQGNGVLVNAGYLPAATGAELLRSFAIGDVDQDGDLDVVVSQSHYGFMFIIGPWPMALLLNDGTGVFTLSPGLPTQSMMAPHVLLADLDGDGDQDLITSGDNVISGVQQPPMVFWNLGQGTFSQTGLQLPAPNTHNVLALGDVNGDGRIDIVSDTGAYGCAATAPPVVLLNLPGATFQPMASTLGLPLPLGVPVLVDIDGDARPDLVRLTAEGTTIHPLGAGTLGPPIATVPLFHATPCLTFPNTSCSNVLDHAIGDVDGDGDQDIVGMTAQGNKTLFNVAGPTVPVLPREPLAASLPEGWTTPLRSPRVADLDGDGDVDLVIGFGLCASLRMLAAFNDGHGNLTQAPPIPVAGGVSDYIWNFEVLDVNGDGNVDLFLADTSSNQLPGQHRVLLGGSGSFSPTQTLVLGNGLARTIAIRSGDLDGDLDRDLVVGMTLNSLNPGAVPSYVLRNAGGGTFQVAATLPPGNTQDIELVDVDGDGDLDIVEANLVYLAGSALFLNDGTGQFTQSPGLPSVAAHSVATGDLDLDGDVDLLLDNMPMLNDGSGVFSTPGVAFAPGASFTPGQLDLIDVDGDSFPDVVDASGRIFPNLGCGSCFGSAVPLPAPLSVPILHADFDRDGDPDLVSNRPAIISNMKRQLARRLPARLGRLASLEIGGPPGTPWLLFASGGTGSLPLPPFGTVFLDLATTQLATAGTIPAGGISTISGVAPSAPSAVGFTVYWQAAMLEPVGPRFTGLEVTTIAAY